MIKLYDTSLVLVAVLQNAFDIGYDQKFNELWTATFSLPVNDPKVAEISPMMFIEMDVGRGDSTDMFRIMPYTQANNDINIITYECEHVLTTLMNDVMFQLHTAGTPTDDTTDAINYVLSQQSVAHWVLGTCSFTRNFEYKWENENLLSALFGIPKPFNTEYQWTWDTTNYPWTLNLVVPSLTPTSRILYKKNLVGIIKQTDPTELITRLYGLGYGEGVNQMTVSEVNSGLPYIDSANIATYGIISRIFADKRYENPETLLGMMQSILKENESPKITYTVQAADIYDITEDQYDKFELGNVVTVQDAEIGIDIDVIIVNISKSDIVTNPGDVELVLSNKVENIRNTIANLQAKASTNDLYSQGAVNIDSHDFQDNADHFHGATLKFYLSDDVVRVNKCKLSYEIEAFRSYTALAISGGGQTSSPSSESTSSGGGGSTTASGAGGGGGITSSSGGGATTSVGAASSSTTTSNGGQNLTSGSGGSSSPETSISYGSSYDGGTGSQADHNHGIAPGAKLSLDGGGYDTFVASGGHSHTLRTHEHTISISNHTHSVATSGHTHALYHNHSITLGDHTHTVGIGNHTHDVTLPDHTHGMEHTHDVDDHNHDVALGIYDYSYSPPSIVIKVDGNIVVGETGLSGNLIDIIPYLDVDGEGKLLRDQFHTVEIVPDTDTDNPDGLARVAMNVVKQVYMQSVGGGSF